MKNEIILSRLNHLAFIIGPLLMLAAAIVYLSGFGMSPIDKTNYIEGILGCYGIVLFIPIYWTLSKNLAESNKVLATVTYITGLLGPTTGFTHMYSRIFEHQLRVHGSGDQVWQSFYANPGGELLSVALLGPLFPLTSILLGIGLWLKRGLPTWMCMCLILAGLCFASAMITESSMLMQTAYPCSAMLWLIVFVGYASRMRKIV